MIYIALRIGEVKTPGFAHPHIFIIPSLIKLEIYFDVFYSFSSFLAILADNQVMLGSFQIGWQILLSPLSPWSRLVAIPVLI